MKVLRLLMILLASLCLISCGDNNKSVNKAQSTNGLELRGKPVVQAQGIKEINAVSPNKVTWGRIFTSLEWTQETHMDFKRHLKSFLSPQILESEVGQVSGDETNSETGIAFWGQGIKYNKGLITPGVGFVLEEHVFNADTAELRISIYQKKNGVVQEIPIHFNDALNGKKSGQLVDSIVEGNYVQLVFADSFGKVSLSGFINPKGENGNAFYEGQIIFKNNLKKNADGSFLNVNHEPEVLGEFRVLACGFFECSK